MNITQFYETIILRDLFEYVTPGVILLSSLGLVLESFAKKLGLGLSIFGAISDGGVLALFWVLILAFPMGHFITGLSSLLLRRRERTQAIDVIKKDPWLGTEAGRAISHYLAISESQTAELLRDPQTAETLRQMGRDLILSRMPTLYREHIGRMSIVSRLCQNMAIALIGLLLSMTLSAVILWKDLQAINQTTPLVLPFASALILIIVGILLPVVFVNRAVKLRRRMIRLTFQIWCVDFYLKTAEQSNASKRGGL